MRKKLLRSRSGFEKPESREEAIMQNILGASNVLEPSESNIEEILKSILYNTPYTKEAEFEIEKILLAIKNNGTYDGEVESRDMKILLAILRDSNYTEEPESRIEELFIEWLQQRQQIKVLEGVPPLTFIARGLPLINYLIEGNTVQNGTPTPTNPIQPSECGERTENLFDVYQNSRGVKDATVDNVRFQYINQSIVLSQTSNGKYPQQQIWGENGALKLDTKAYYCQLFVENAPENANIYVLVQVSNDNFQTSNSIVIISTVGRTFTPSDDFAAYRYVFVCQGNGITYNNTTVRISIVEGATAPSKYEPYGYKIPISSAGQTTPVYLGEVESTRQIKKYVFTGQETPLWVAVITDTDAYQFPNETSGYKREPFICSHMHVNTDSSTTNTHGYIGQRLTLCFDKTMGLDTTDKVKTYLQQQYAAGTPVTVWYVLATETTGIVNEPLMRIGDYADSVDFSQAGVQIPTNNGSTTVDVDTTLKPSNVYIEYK